MPIKKIKLHKHKQKKSKWITTGIIKSIKFRDNLHKRLKQTSPVTLEFWNIKHNLKEYNKILKRSIHQAKVQYYNHKFNSCKTILQLHGVQSMR